MVGQKTEKGSLKTSVAEQLVKFDASQQQDVQAIGERVAILQAEAEQWQTQVQARSDEAQAISVNTLEVREETAARRTDVLRLRHELEEARTDLFRLNEILRHDTDQLLRVELENQALDQRLQQLQQ
jgi:chromosome segregation ATPase